MNAKETLKKLKEDKKLVTLILMLLCGAALIALSFRISPQKEGQAEPRGADLAYASTEMESRLSGVLSSIAGAGDVEVMVVQDEGGVRGVLVVADGAGELTVRTELMRAAMTALDVPASSVEVFARESEQGE
jgi:hypothetical protein